MPMNLTEITTEQCGSTNESFNEQFQKIQKLEQQLNKVITERNYLAIKWNELADLILQMKMKTEFDKKVK